MSQHQRSRLKDFVHYDQKSTFQESLIVKIIRYTKNYKFVDVEVRIGHLKFPKISILNVDVESPLHSEPQIAKGVFGTIYQCEC